MLNFMAVVGFLGLAIPLFVIMMAIVIYSNSKAKEVDLETNEDCW